MSPVASELIERKRRYRTGCVTECVGRESFDYNANLSVRRCWYTSTERGLPDVPSHYSSVRCLCCFRRGQRVGQGPRIEDRRGAANSEKGIAAAHPWHDG